jgi:SAM-dependent methyltransferase
MTEYQQHIITHIEQMDRFIQAVLSGREANPYQTITIRPVELKQGIVLQFTYWDGKQDVRKNVAVTDAAAVLTDLFPLPWKSITVQTTTEDISVQFSKKGKAILHRHKTETPRPLPEFSHDRPKAFILSPETSANFLHALGMMTNDGRIKADAQRKFRQINQFLQLITATIDFRNRISSRNPISEPLHLVDFGCGNAYLTFAAYHYFNDVLGIPTTLTGVDIKANLIERHRQTSQELGWERMIFHDTRIIGYQPHTPPDMVLALHACDTATDEALAQAVRWQSRFIFAAPCCHHHLQAQLSQQIPPEPFGPVLEQGILRERLGDILTDTFRAQLLRIMGYQTDVVEFIETEHTPRNLMIRGELVGTRGNAEELKSYEALKTFWRVTPYLETLLGVTG